ncbi:hypothetical protein AOT83_07355 [Mycobacteroides sp. H001]|nr:hypothetical protein AOT86_07575 [Mycobacteroides sp. H072]KRQ38444.1 hypothetical protein AOT84_08285 [Mycobacteroides sp. H002]KRQ49131.1 hypothetical protein AOT85_18605 [Mycobacteroides sp. H054]KRQ71423.1 hypothetical protein AOT83_07355 [Mycobacteroides sp. H001]OHU32440.1 hypothetical protein BKG79_25005 [Mycobacteroides chelonae]
MHFLPVVAAVIHEYENKELPSDAEPPLALLNPIPTQVFALAKHPCARQLQSHRRVSDRIYLYRMRFR